MSATKTTTICAAGALALLLGAAATSRAAADPVMRQIDENTVSITDFRGKPPFRRRIVKIDDLSSAEFARFEEITTEAAADESRIGERVTVVDYRGKPPFKRRSVEIDEANVAEFARFEEVTEEPEQRSRRRGPPGKGLLLRR
jgi:hypothetical protein